MPSNDEPTLDSGSNVPAQDSEEKEFDALIEEYLGAPALPHYGEPVQARVVSVSKEYVLVDVGDKAEGIVPTGEFTDHRGEVTIKEGDVVEVVVRGRDNETGQVIVSREQARHQEAWKRVVEAFEKKLPVHGYVTKVIPTKGLLVDIGVSAFMPATHVDIARGADLASFVGQEIDAYVLAVDTDERGRRSVKISRRRLLEEEQASKRAELIASLQEGAVITGKVKKHASFGVFVDLGPLDALVPREELAWEKRVDPTETLRLGYSYKFKVLKVDPEHSQVTLSRRLLKPDPWTKIETDYPLELVVRAKVTNITSNAAYVLLDDGIEGRIGHENLSWALNVRRPSDILAVGDEVKAVVIGYDKDRRLLNLSLKQVTADPWAEIEQKYPVGSTVKVKVLDVVAYGAFVQLDETTKGLIHVSDMSYDKNFRDPKKLLKRGDEVDAVVVKIDYDNRRINLGIKQLEDDPFELFLAQHPEGSVVTGKVKSITDYGAFVELAPRVEALLHVSQWDKERVQNLASVLNVGDEVTAKIVRVDRKDRKIGLSRRQYLIDQERKEIDHYRRDESPVDATIRLGDLLKDIREKLG
jgi:small subunit ribosomal protein S1